MEKDVGIRQYRTGDEEEIVHLLQSVFVGWPKFDVQCSSLDHWKWKYFDNPLKSNVITLAESEGKIIGCTHGLFLTLRLGDKTIVSQLGGDLAVDINFQGRGIMGRLMKEKYEELKDKGVKMLYEITSNPIVNKWKLKEGYLQFPYDIRHYIKIRDIDLYFKMSNIKNKFIKKYGYKTLNKVIHFKNVFTHKRDISSDFNIVKVDGIDESFDSFWEKIRDNYEFIIERDASYLKWRYCDIRGGNYIVKKACYGDEFLGYIVIRVNNYVKEYPVGYIVDLLTVPDRLDVAHALICDACNYFMANNVNVIHSLAIKGHPYESLLLTNNFVKQTNYRIIHSIHDVGEELHSFLSAPPRRLHFAFGDTDWI